MNFKFDLQMFATPVQPTLNNTFNYTASDRDNGTNWGALLEPKFRKIFFETYDELKEQYTSVFNIQTSSKAKEHDWGAGAFGAWTQRASQLDAVDYKTLHPGLERTYTHNAFTQGFMVTREMYDDEQYRVLDKLPQAMARSGRAKVEKDAISFLTNGFTTAIYDSKYLFANDHPLLDSASVGDNLTTGALTADNLKAAILLMQQTPDEAGVIAQYMPTKLIVPPALEDVAIRITQSDKVTGSANNDTNKYLNKYGLEIVVLPFLSAAAGGSDTAWYLMDGSRHELNFFWRVRPEFKWHEDYDTFVAKYRGYMRYSYGCSDWRGIVGSTGL